MPAELLSGEPVARRIREVLEARIDALADRGVVPTVGTVLMTDDPGDERFMELKHAACRDAGVATRDVRLDPDDPADRLYDAVDRLCADPDVHAVFVQVPLPDHVTERTVRERLDPVKDVDCMHHGNLGRLVAGHPRFVPATTAAVLRLLDAYDVEVAGADVVVVGRSGVIGAPLANRLLSDGPQGNATVTVCHSRTDDLASHTRRADVLVTAAGTPGLVDGSMLSPGAIVVDVSANRVPASGDGPSDGDAATSAAGDGSKHRDPAPRMQVVGDVDLESAREVVAAITPVPGGVGPVTLAMLLANVVEAAERQAQGG